MQWKYYDVARVTEAGQRRRRLGVPQVGDVHNGWIVVAVIPVTGRRDHVQAIVVVQRCGQTTKGPDLPEGKPGPDGS